MSELVNIKNVRPNARGVLLATTSAIALSMHCSAMEPALAADGAKPTVWIEVGSQLESMTGKDDPFVPPFDPLMAPVGLPSLTSIENTMGKNFGAEGKLMFQPKGSDWVFAISARYGRTSSSRRAHKEVVITGPRWAPLHLQQFGGGEIQTQYFTVYAEQRSKSSAAHTIIDFQVGKDVGLGLLGHRTQSVVGLGARYAQFNSSSEAFSYAAPDAEFALYELSPGKYDFTNHHHNSASVAQRHNDFRGIGPSISMSNTTALLGSMDEGLLGLDWDVNAAVLFGRQHSKVQHQSTVRDLGGGAATGWHINYAVTNPVQTTRSRSVIIPNLGGALGLSYRFTNAKLSAGYRADFFFGALDRGLDARQSVTTGYHGPYATFSIGLSG